MEKPAALSRVVLRWFPGEALLPQDAHPRPVPAARGHGARAGRCLVEPPGPRGAEPRAPRWPTPAACAPAGSSLVWAAGRGGGCRCPLPGACDAAFPVGLRADLVGLRTGARARVCWRGLVREPCTAAPPPPAAVSPRPCFCSLSHDSPRAVFTRAATSPTHPLAPSCADPQVGRERRDAVALWQGPGSPRGPAQGRASALRHAGVAAPGPPGQPRSLPAGPPPPTVRTASPGAPGGAHPAPAPRSVARLRRPGAGRPRDPYFKYDLWSRLHRQPPPPSPRAHTAAANCVFFIWVSFAQGLPRGSLGPAGFAPSRPPLRSAPGVPVAPPAPPPPNPAGPTHRADLFLSVCDRELLLQARG